MEIKFKKIRIRNFRGLVSFDANLEGRSVRISGANGLGKSSVADAITWVLFGKDSRRRTAFPIDPVDDAGRIIHNLDVSVELEMLIDGQPTTLRRRRQEKWVQKRGMTTEQLDGHQTTCYIDGRPLPSSDFSSHVDTIVKEELFRALTTPDYFPSLPMDQQYRLLVKIVGTRTLAEIAAKDEEAMKVVDELGQRSLDQYRQGLSYDLQRTRKEQELIPVRLSEVQGFIEQVKAKGADGKTAQRHAKGIEEKLRQVTQEIDSMAGVVRAENARYNDQRAYIQQLRQQRAAIEDRIEKQNREARSTSRWSARPRRSWRPPRSATPPPRPCSDCTSAVSRTWSSSSWKTSAADGRMWSDCRFHGTPRRPSAPPAASPCLRTKPTRSAWRPRCASTSARCSSRTPSTKRARSSQPPSSASRTSAPPPARRWPRQSA